MGGEYLQFISICLKGKSFGAEGQTKGISSIFGVILKVFQDETCVSSRNKLANLSCWTLLVHIINARDILSTNNFGGYFNY